MNPNPRSQTIAAQRRRRHFILALALAVLPLFPLQAQTITLVDFGANAAANTFGLSGWNNVLLSPDMSYSAAGPDGVALRANYDEYSDFMGVRGTAHNFQPGERIVVTWYNNSDQEYSISARISFTDADRPGGGTTQGPWFTMRAFADYRQTYQIIQPRAEAKTVFNITSSGVHKSDGPHTMVNINLHVEWFETWPKEFILCDRIELMNDADITPPSAPAGVSAEAISDSQVRLRWEAPADNTAVVAYLIYLDGEVEGYSREPEYTALFLESGRSGSFTVTALDQAGNQSQHSPPVRVAARAWSQAADLINPAGLLYRGAFRLPETFAWGGEAMTFRSDGDGGTSGGGAADGYPGSLFVTDLNQAQQGFVGEVAIPAPLISTARNVEELPVARLLREPVNIRPADVNGWGDYVDIWRTGLAWQSDEGRLYSIWSVHYTVTGEKHACLSSCRAADPGASPKSGAWYIGDPAAAPNDAMLGDYLFTLPADWAAQHCAGRTLVTGRCRDGGLSGLGPTLYAVAPVGATPPPVKTVLPFTRLLEYGPVTASDYYHFPEAIDGYLLSDSWRDAAWLSAGAQHAVMFIGSKARGENWYGYNGERMAHDWVIADEPYPDFYATDPDGKGWKSQNFIPMALFFDPGQLARVAGGTLPASRPQPYAAKRFERDFFFGAAAEIRTAAFDASSRRLYVLEFDAAREGLAIVHVWEVREVTTSAGARRAVLPGAWRLEQNYPNPFNARTRIVYHLPARERVVMDLFDTGGRRIARILDAWREGGRHEEHLDISAMVSGVYFLRLRAGDNSGVIKLVTVK